MGGLFVIMLAIPAQCYLNKSCYCYRRDDYNQCEKYTIRFMFDSAVFVRWLLCRGNDLNRKNSTTIAERGVNYFLQVIENLSRALEKKTHPQM